jgi:aspartate 1-decarboxylase
MNGAAARLTQVDDRIIVIAYAQMEPEEAKNHKPTVVVVDETNEPKDIFRNAAHGQKYGLENGIIEE